MPLHPKQRFIHERFFPGLVDAILALGAGEFESQLPQLFPKGNGLREVRLRLVYRMTDGHAVDLRNNLRVLAGAPPCPMPPDGGCVDLREWERYYYSLHYGKSFDDATFRFDLEGPFAHHVHIRPNPKPHVLAKDVVPDVSNISPEEFVKKVAAYRELDIYPVKRK